MLKNKTEEFRQRYSSISKFNCKSNLQIKNQNILVDKLALTGFSNQTSSNSIRNANSRRISKVQSTALLKSRQLTRDHSQVSTSVFNIKHLQDVFHIKKQKKLLCVTSNANINQANQLINQANESINQANQSITKQKKIIKIKQDISTSQFLQKLSPRNLFFCCKCFRFIFAIQKKHHHPKCQNLINIQTISTHQRQQIGWQRLKIIKQLSQYTNFITQQVNNLYQDAKKGKIEIQYLLEIQQNVQVLNFQQIIQAFLITYQTLLKGTLSSNSTIFSINKLIGCFQPATSSKKWFN